MAIDTRFIGKTYPEVKYHVCREKIREYALAIKNPDKHYLDENFAAQTKYGTIIAPPTFCVVFGAHLIAPVFSDQDLKLNLAMLVHGEQEFEFYEVVKDGDIITSRAHISNIVNKEKLDVISIEVLSKNQLGEDVCKGVYTFVIRK
ncbi:MAG: MaoC family dehydratase N-terminal domain-containing protein [Spirochaetes bacterium]|nr:MaoC family dehydratase N-terminal domain-containing protein [Spirochaetota bacterium]